MSVAAVGCQSVGLPASDAQGASQEGWVQSRSPREMPQPPGAVGTHTGEFPCFLPLIPSAWGAVGGWQGSHQAPPTGCRLTCRTLWPKDGSLGGGACWSPQRGLRLGVLCVSVCVLMRLCVYLRVAGCVCVWRVCLWGVDPGS